MPTRNPRLPSPSDALQNFAARAQTTDEKPNIGRWVPMPQQEVVLKCQLKHRVVTGGNRSGKSAVAFADDALVLIRRHPYRQWMYPDLPIQMRIIGTDFDRGIEQTAVPYMKQYIPPSFLINGAWESSYSASSHMLTLADGSTCSFMSFEQDANKFQSVALMHCADDETQALTRRGWLHRDAVTTDDEVLARNPQTGLMEWVQVEQVYQREVVAEPMTRFTSRGAIDALVTAGHRWVVENKKTKHQYFKRTDDLKKQEQFIVSAPSAHDPDPVFSDDFVRLIGWVATDGSYRESSMKIHQSLTANPDKCEEIAGLTNGATYDQPYPNGVMRSYGIRGELRLAVLAILSGEYKVIPENFILALSADQREILLETLIKADGMHLSTGGWMIAQSRRERRDPMMMLATLCGYTVGEYRNTTTWNVQGKRKDGRYDYSRSSVASYSPTEEVYTGWVWCPNNQFESWVARRNGRVYLTGNCHFDEEPPLAIWQESMLRLLDYGGTWMLSQTPVTQSEWIDDLVVTPARAEQDEPGARIAVFDLLTEQNTHLDQAAVAEVQIGMTAEQKAIRMRGEYTGTDKVFPKFTGKYPYVISHEAFLAAFNTRDWVVYRSMDHGLKNPTAWIWSAVHRNGGIVTFRVLYAAGVDLDNWARRVKEADMEVGEMLGLGRINTFEPAGCFGDPSIIRKDQAIAITSIQQEYAMRGVPISVQGIAAARGQANQNIGLAKINGYLQLRPASVSPVTLQANEPQWQITDWHDGRAGFEYADNLHLVSEVQRARVPPQSLNNKQNHNVIEQIRDKDNHAIDAVKYLFMALPQINGAFSGGQLDDHSGQDMMAAMGDHGWRMPPAASRLVLPTSTTPGYYGDPDLGMNL